MSVGHKVPVNKTLYKSINCPNTNNTLPWHYTLQYYTALVMDWVSEGAVSTNPTPTHTSKHVLKVLAVIEVVQVENKGYPPKNNL